MQNKKTILLFTICVLLLLGVLTACGVPNKVLYLDIGTTKEKVIQKLGDPSDEDGNTFYYYSKEYEKDLGKIEKLLDSDVETEKDLEKLEKKIDKLVKEMSQKTYSLTEITFKDDVVESIIYNSTYKDNQYEYSKQVLAARCIDGGISLLTGNGYVIYEITYNDGSYAKAKVQVSNKHVLDEDEYAIIDYDGDEDQDAALYKVGDKINTIIRVDNCFGVYSFDVSLKVYETEKEISNKLDKVKTHKITYDFGEYEYDISEMPSIYAENEELVIPTPTIIGYTFSSWSVEIKVSKNNFTTNTFYYNGTDYIIPKGVEGDITLKASFRLNSYNIEYSFGVDSYYLYNSSSQPSNYDVKNTKNFSSLQLRRRCDGLEFKGWYLDEDYTQRITSTAGKTGNLHLYAKWDTTMRINYVLNGGTNSISNPTTYSGESFVLENPSREGATFNGWSMHIGYGSAVNLTDSHMITKNLNQMIDYLLDGYDTVTLTANWSLIQYNITYNIDDSDIDKSASYTVSFNTGSGSSISSQIITNTNGLVYPNIPTRSGYAFAGWYTTSSYSTPFDFTSSVTQDTTVYAKWTSMNSGYNNRYYIDARNYNSTSNNYSLSTYGTSSSYPNYVYFTALTSGTYYLYYKNGSSSSNYQTYMNVYDLTQGSTIISNSAKSNTDYYNYSFYANAGDVIYLKTYRYSTSSSSYYTTFYFYLTGTTTPSANGKASGIISIDYPNSNPTTYTVESDITLNSITMNNYYVDGWYDDATLTNRITKINNSTGVKTLYAKVYYKYNINYYLNGGNNNQSNPSYYAECMSSIQLKDPTKEGHTFNGWYTTSTFEPGTQITTLTPNNVTGNKSLYAKFTINQYTMSFETNGGAPIDSITQNYGTAITSSTTTTKEGYSFVGWYTKSSFASSSSFTISTMPGYDVKLYAKWSLDTYDINYVWNTKEISASSILYFDSNGGSAVDSQVITATNGLVYPDIPTKSGYVFAGWYTSTSYTSLFDFTISFAGTKTAYAKWIRHTGDGVLPLNGTINNINAQNMNSSTKKLYAFVPLTNGSVTIYSTGSGDSFGYLYDESKHQLTANDDGGSNNNFSITYYVYAGRLYYAVPCGYDSSITLSLTMSGASMPSANGKASPQIINTNPVSYNITSNDIELTNASLSWFVLNEYGDTIEYYYDFLGWYTENTFVNPVTTIESSSLSDITLYAKWGNTPQQK